MQCWLAVVTLLMVAAEFPMPPLQTEVQKAVVAAHAETAKVASQAATPQVIQIFDSPVFRAGLQQCCKAAADLPSEELLRHLRAEVRSAELAHAFPSQFIASVGEYGWLLNEWQGPMVDNKTANLMYNVPEENIFGLPPFADRSRPTWEEAADRLIYVSHNLRQLDTGGAPIFGDVVVVFRNSYVQDMVLIAAVDTGIFEMTCNRSGLPNSSHFPPLRPSTSCAQWEPPVLGTLEHFDHSILANLGFWSSGFNTSIEETAVGLFSRGPLAGKYLDLPKIGFRDLLTFYEADILGNPRLPEGVSFLVGDFRRLFGTDAGRDLQRLADKFSFPLIWALSANVPRKPHLARFGQSEEEEELPFPPVPPFEGNQRVLDPEALGSRALNATAGPQAQAAFERLWTEIMHRRRLPLPIMPWAWEQWWSTLAASQVRLAPLTAEAGCAQDHCIGTVATSGACVCAVARDSTVVLI